MTKHVTFGNILTILGILVLPLIVWGVNVERRFEKTRSNSKDIQELKQEYTRSNIMIIQNHEEQMEKLHSIELQLKDKVNR